MLILKSIKTKKTKIVKLPRLYHSNFEVADRFYNEFIPELKELIAEGRKHGKSAAANEVETEMYIVLNSEMHRWYLGKMDPAEAAKRKEAYEKFRNRYTNTDSE